MTERAQPPPAARNAGHAEAPATDSDPVQANSAQGKAPATLPVITAAGAAFCVGLIGFALQMRAGDDPAIGAGPQATAQQPRKVIVRRIIERRIVAGPGGGGAAAASGAAPASGGSQASSSGAAPAATPVPAAPPAPAVSRGS